MNLILLTLIISFLWGISPIAYKKVLANVDNKLVFILNSFFYTLCIILYTIYYWSSIKEEYSKIKTNDIYIVAIISIFMSFIPNIIYFYLLKHYDSSIVTILVSSSPIFTIAISYFIFSEKKTRNEMIGVGLIILGIIFISLKNIN